MGVNKNTQRKPTTFSRVLTDSFHTSVVSPQWREPMISFVLLFNCATDMCITSKKCEIFFWGGGDFEDL